MFGWEQDKMGDWNLSELEFVRIHFYSKLEIPILTNSNSDKFQF